jgi:site-specific DNA recombinase
MSFDGYIRVSDRKGREGERFLSPTEQRETIERLLPAGAELGELVSEMDVKGSTPIDERELGRLVRKVEAGESDGIIVWKVTRFSRSVIDGAVVCKRVMDAGGRLIGSDGDTGTPGGKMVIQMMLVVAENELDGIRENWAAARSGGFRRGIPNGRVVRGYRKLPLPDGRPVIVEREAAKVRDAFERRAAGESFSAIGRRHGWSHSTVRQMIGNPAYVGVARMRGERDNESAYPPIVTRQLFDQANATRTTQPAASGATTSERLLRGLATCAGCGRTLKVVRRRRANGSHATSYYCKNAASEPCADRAFVHAEPLEQFVCEWFREALEQVPRLVDVVSAGRELDRAQAEQEQAEAELVAYVENASVRDPAVFQRGLTAREKRADAARERVRHLSARLVRIPTGGPLHRLWADFDAAERRDVLRGFLGRVAVSRGASSDLRGHVRIVWSDGTVVDDETTVGVAAA